MSDYLTWLASLDESELATLLVNRPEVLRGTPARDLAAVESRLSQHQAVAVACSGSRARPCRCSPRCCSAAAGLRSPGAQAFSRPRQAAATTSNR